VPLDELDEIRRPLRGLDEPMLEQILRGRSQEGISLETRGDKLAERLCEVRVESGRCVFGNEEEDLRSRRQLTGGGAKESGNTFIGCSSAYGGSPLAISIACDGRQYNSSSK
jgi:hypothetical protein